MNSKQITIPRYLKIAVDISAKISSGEIKEGDKLKGRSVLSPEYNVSPETIRRAMSILQDKQVVEILGGSGAVVLSREKAITFLKNFQDDESVVEMRRKLQSQLEYRRQLDEEIAQLTSQIVDMYKFKRSDLISPVEISLFPRSHVIGKSIGALEVWHNTGATILGIIRKDSILISPGPYYAFAEDDKVLIVGDQNVIERFNAFIQEKP